jgi:hypothetical protein
MEVSASVKDYSDSEDELTEKHSEAICDFI